MAKQRLVILGGGESGVGTALLGKAKGFEVFVSDKNKIKEKYKDVLIHHEIEWEEETHTESKILNANLVMKSPGIPERVPLVKQLREQGVPIVSEIEFAAKFTQATLVGITGSNGKTTTASLTHHILKQELEVGLAGNIGDSFAKQILEKNYPNYVLEISSFQLDDIVGFKPHIAIITNITPDHLDRYNYEFENYITSKFRIAENQTKADYLIFDADDPVIVDWLEKHPVQSTLLPFSLVKKNKNGAYLENDKIIITIDNNSIDMSTKDLALEGKHNIKNAMAASTVAHLLRIRKQTIRESLENFHGVEHRLENVLKINKVQYINDSKATNVNATYYALESMDAPTVWIVGGQDKGNNYQELFPFVNEKVKAIICLGVDNQKLMENFSSMVDVIIETQSMSEAVKIAYKLAESGDNVLLSPACASFDLFENYEDRGRQFKEAVRNL
ncbi:MAG: UDP-N-acetylmuramoyl-L-alanine--D-glutamate ligase [Xanthomarina sp.]|uniref:UDP-N-acetylmuramoylalanine--D-glutamate ligase n=1 Tax=Xanthomarina gelatinilytica TaxID=1137281 RepID=M7NAR5_9FLAO|nr:MULTISPECIES: UDP-N-acetylmuramoyl-L-alanine--D-glutamate ligase [Xanthomarina]EMQ95588.1 UDP-N-acetylmuramoylalanine--D-glutamate ligase [Xanthomarina gelatinilytica]MAL23157.1 UDP-N-acetylmuramoyl-L-alanine--D-glutamate ligase [Xanthomarina sp.]MBF60602.1 UDP-N-acetylmuramoyl-L-alanine--D-glutamate ligase [Xanthomarina sp.]|tara:strand:+ start:325 stop:1662 length:1338 start_codon:yes stop_codon:yes gene_type:complete